MPFMVSRPQPLEPESLETRWRNAYAAAAFSPFDGYEVASSVPSGAVSVAAGGLLGCYTREGELAVSVHTGSGVLRESERFCVRTHFERVQAESGASSVVLPMVHEDHPLARALYDLQGALILPRRPTAQIDWSDDGASLWRRCEARLGTRAGRRRRRFESAGYVLTTLRGRDAMDAIVEVESKSWKAAAGQGMVTRGQVDLYSALLGSAGGSARVVLFEGQPVAYRLDHVVGRTLWCLKWSFDEGHRATSPGFYLLAADLPRSVEGLALDLVDLAGSPDHLKVSLQTGTRERTAFAWPASEAARRWCRERRAHDERTRQTWRAGHGIRHGYEAP